MDPNNAARSESGIAIADDKDVVDSADRVWYTLELKIKNHRAKQLCTNQIVVLRQTF